MPHKCPICLGHGIVPFGFYMRTAEVTEWTCGEKTTEQCRACFGRGIIWSVEFGKTPDPLISPNTAIPWGST